jgi:hypothetical protein
VENNRISNRGYTAMNEYELSKKWEDERKIKAEKIKQIYQENLIEWGIIKIPAPYHSTYEKFKAKFTEFINWFTDLCITSGEYFCCPDDGYVLHADDISLFLAHIEFITEYVTGMSIEHLRVYTDLYKSELKQFVENPED